MPDGLLVTTRDVGWTFGSVIRLAAESTMMTGAETTAKLGPKSLPHNMLDVWTGFGPLGEACGAHHVGMTAKSLDELGFLTAIETPDDGLFGGYLTVRPNGRPLEFFCTSPVVPSRAQQVLYGPTLRSFLLAECIGPALVLKASRRQPILLTDLPAMLDVRSFVSTPVVLIQTAQPQELHWTHHAAPADDDQALDSVAGGHVRSMPQPCVPQHPKEEPHDESPELTSFRVARQTVYVAAQHCGEFRAWIAPLAHVAERLDLSEPFERIRQAIDEARRVHDAA
jgi:hypothetical protein